MPERAPRATATMTVAAAALALVGVAPDALAACRVMTTSPVAAPVQRSAAPASGGSVVLVLPRSRPSCRVLARVGAARLTVLSLRGGAVQVRRGARVLARIRAPQRAVTVTVDTARDRVRLTATGRRVVRRVTLPGPGAVVSRRGVRVTRPSPGARPGPAQPGTTRPRPTTTRPPVTSPPPSGTVAAPGTGPFSAASVFNAPLSSSAPVAPASPGVVADLVGQVRSAGAWVNSDRWSVPVYVVPAGAPTRTVRDADDGGVERWAGEFAWGQVPLPADARASLPADGDMHLVVWQPSSDTMWEFWRFRWTSSGPVADHGARIPRVSRNPASIPSPWGATASGIPLAAGLVTAADIQRGRIDHALALAVPELRAGAFRSPATRTDGGSGRGTAPVMGSRLRLDPSVDVAALGLPPLTRMLAEAAQRYGVVLRDTSGAVTFYVEDPQSAGRDLVAPLLGGRDTAAALGAFPWDRLQLLAP